MPKFKPLFIKSFQTNGSADSEDTFDFVSSIEEQSDEPVSKSGKTDPIEEFVDNHEGDDGQDSWGAVLDFTLTGNEDWDTKPVDDFLF